MISHIIPLLWSGGLARCHEEQSLVLLRVIPLPCEEARGVVRLVDRCPLCYLKRQICSLVIYLHDDDFVGEGGLPELVDAEVASVELLAGHVEGLHAVGDVNGLAAAHVGVEGAREVLLDVRVGRPRRAHLRRQTARTPVRRRATVPVDVLPERLAEETSLVHAVHLAVEGVCRVLSVHIGGARGVEEAGSDKKCRCYSICACSCGAAAP